MCDSPSVVKSAITLQMLVDYWDPDSESFCIDGMSLTIEVEEIYFITGLSR